MTDEKLKGISAPDRPTLEITREMIEAGAEAYRSLGADSFYSTDYEVVSAVLKAALSHAATPRTE